MCVRWQRPTQQGRSIGTKKKLQETVKWTPRYQGKKSASLGECGTELFHLALWRETHIMCISVIQVMKICQFVAVKHKHNKKSSTLKRERKRESESKSKSQSFTYQPSQRPRLVLANRASKDVPVLSKPRARCTAGLSPLTIHKSDHNRNRRCPSLTA